MGYLFLPPSLNVQPRIVELPATREGPGFTLQPGPPSSVRAVTGLAAQVAGVLPADLVLEVDGETCAETPVERLEVRHPLNVRVG